MLYYLFHWLHVRFRIPGFGVMDFITFRAAIAFVLSLFIAIVIGKRIIRYLQIKQVGEEIRNLGLQGQMEKKGTPTMGGLIIVAACLIPAVLFAKVATVYVWLAIISTIWLCAIGFLDDYIKVFRKRKDGLRGQFKLLGQVGLGVIVGLTLHFNENVTIRERMSEPEIHHLEKTGQAYRVIDTVRMAKKIIVEHKSLKTTIPFIKKHELDYGRVLAWMNPDWERHGWILYVAIAIFIITAVSNGANITDGLDGLAAGTSAIIISTLALLMFLSGNAVFARYLNIMFIPNLGEMVIFAGCLVGAIVGFLWYNAYPAQVFMGDTGSLTLGGLIALMALMVRKELLIPVLCGIFLVELLSVMLQVSYFKYTKRKYGEGRRILKMSPLHHHFQKMNFHETKIVARFWIVGVGLAILTIITLKTR